jgi:4-amino-4-deoxy-L-arabinose transferase-like glycosyltransferase
MRNEKNSGRIALNSSRIPHPAFLIAVVLLLAYFFTRLHQLMSFPVFGDEALHVIQARDVYDLRPFTGALNGKLFGLWWMAAMGLQGDGVIFVIRAATVIFGALTVAALFGLGRYFAGLWGGALAAAFYILSPYALFYDRLALVDPYVTAFGALLAWFSLRAAVQGRAFDALAAGAMLVGAILAKATGVMLWVIPLAAYLLLGKQTWRIRLRLTCFTYVFLLVVWLPFFFFLQWRGYSYFSTATDVVGAGFSSDFLSRLWRNLIAPEGMFTIDAVYFSAPFLFLALVTTVFLVTRRLRHALFLVAVMALPLGGLLAFADRLSPRYFHLHVPFALLLVAVGVMALAVWLYERLRLPRTVLPLGVLLAWGGLFAIPYHLQYARDPAALPMPALDREEYVAFDAAGFAVDEAARYIVAERAGARRSLVVVGLLPQCEALALYIGVRPDVQVECPLLMLDGSAQPGIDARIADLERDATSEVWVAYEKTPYTRLDGIADMLTPLQTFVRPGGQSEVELFAVVSE